MSNFLDRLNQMEDEGPLPWWSPTVKTPTIVGVVAEYRELDTEYGTMTGAMVVPETQCVVRDGKGEKPRLSQPDEAVMVWLKETTLRNAWNKPKPVGGPPRIGERVGVKFLGTKESEKYRREYKVFGVIVDGRQGEAPKEQDTEIKNPVDDFDTIPPPEDDDLPF